MKRIMTNLKNYVEAPIDDKNILSDSIIESLFDDGNYVWERNEAVGFIAGYPCYVKYEANRLRISYIARICRTADQYRYWARTVIERVVGSPFKGRIPGDNGLTFKFLNDDVSKDFPEEQLISSVTLDYDDIHVDFYFNQKKQ